MRKWLIFPVVNTVIVGMLGAALGYYLGDVVSWLAAGLAAGALIGLLLEGGFRALGGWVYKHRVLAAALLQLSGMIVYVAPYVLTVVQLRPLPASVCCIDEAGLGDQVEAVRIESVDGVTLVGWYAPPSPEKGGAVVMVLHGSFSTRLSSLTHAQRLHEAGYGVLVYDQRALGESTGAYQSTGYLDVRDLPPIIDWLSARPEVNPERIGGVGLSLGGYILLMAAEDEPRLRAVWADGVAINDGADIPPPQDAAEAFVSFMLRQILWMHELVLGVDVRPFGEIIPNIGQPVAIIAGSETQYDLEERTALIYAPLMVNDLSLVWIVEGAGHVGGWWTDRPGCEQRLFAFFDAAFGLSVDTAPQTDDSAAT